MHWLLRKHRPSTTVFSSQKWAALVAAPLAMPFLIYPEYIINLLTGLETAPTIMVYALTALIVGTLSTVLASGSGKRIMMMSGAEKKVLGMTISELALNVSITVTGLIVTGNMLAAALGTLVAQIIIPWLWVLPGTCRHLGLAKRAGYAVLNDALRAAALPALILLTGRLFTPELGWQQLAIILTAGASTPLGWYWFCCNADERGMVQQVLGRLVLQKVSSVVRVSRSHKDLSHPLSKLQNASLNPNS